MTISKKFIIVGLLFFTISAYSQERTNYNIGDKFPDFELKTVDGKNITLESLKDKVVFINFWFTACVPCIEEMPTLNDLQEAYKDKVEFLSVTFDKVDKVQKFLSKREFNFKHIVDAKSLLIEKMKNQEYPKNLIIDRNGIITYFRGGLPFTKDKKTGKMVPFPYTFFKEPIENALAK